MKHKNYFLNKIHSYFSILFFAVTLMVSGDVWGVDYYMAGEGIPGLNWNFNCWTLTNENNVYYYKIASLGAAQNSYKFKLNPSTDTSWSSQLNTDHLDQSKSNVEFFDGGDKRISFNTYQTMDVYVYTDGTKVWVLQHYAGASTYDKSVTIRGDLWCSGGWAGGGSDVVPVLGSTSDKKSFIMSFIMPALSSNSPDFRMTLCRDGNDKTEGSDYNFVNNYRLNGSQTSWNVSSGTGSSKLVFSTSSFSGNPKQVTCVYSNSKFYAMYNSYPVKKTGWKVIIDGGAAVDMNSDGEYVSGTLSSGSHTIKVTDGGKVHAINWFGGLYIDQSHSDVSFSGQQYYGDKFSKATSWPINGKEDPTGKFSLNAAGVVKVTFDGGKITINTYTPATTYPVHFQTNGGSVIADVNVPENSAVTKPADPTKNNKVFAGWYSDSELQNKYDFSTPVTQEMTLFAKWGDPFTQGETIYFYIGQDNNTKGWADANANIRALFYSVNDKNYCINTSNDKFGDSKIGSVDLGQSQFNGEPTSMERINNSYWYKVVVPYSNAGYIRIVRLSSDPHYMWCYATTRSAGERDEYPSIKLTSNANRDSGTEWYNESPYRTVSFDLMGHGEAINPVQVLKGEKVTKPTDPSAAGWEFKNWYTENTLTNVYDFNSAVNDNKTLYAKWEEFKCPSYSFHNGPESGDWIIPLCFEQVGSTSEWKIENFVIDGTKPKFYVGYQGSFYNDKLGKNQQSRSKNKTLSEAMSFAQTQNNDGPKVGNATGAVGTLRIYDDSDWDNLMCAFIPNGYGLMYGANATGNSIALKATAVGTVFMTDDVTLTADMLKTDGSYKYQVGLATATAGQYVACDNSEKANMGSMGSYVTGDDWQGNVSTYAAGNKGKFRIWIDKTNKNWLCHFVPYWTLKYDLNGQSGTAPLGAEVFSEASQQDRTITITSTIPQATHKVFDGWYTQATGGDKVTGSIELTKHTTLFAHWTDAPQWTVSFDSDGGSAVASQTVWNGETATEPSPAPTKTDLSLKEWQLNGVKYDFSTPVTSNITLKAIWSDVCDMTDVKYAEPTVAQMTANNLFDEDDNTEPAQLTKCQIKVGSQGSNVAYYDANDANGYIKHGEGSSDAYYWYKIEAGTASYATDGKIYYFKNVSNGKYLRVVDGNFGGGNWDWKYVITDTKTDANNDRCKWFFKSSNGNARLVNFASKKSDNNAYQTGEHFLHRYEVNSAPCNTYVVAGSSDGNQGNWQLTTSLINSSTVDNPNYLKEKVEQGGKTYYRFANNAVVSTTLPTALKAEDKITVYYYATAATTAELRINGTKVADITITSAGANTYVYTAVAGDAGQTAVAVASNSTSFLMAQMEVARPTPTSPRASNLAWDTDLSAGVTRMVDAGAFTHTATAKGAGAITYSSSVPAVATVNAATGLVTPVAAGTTVIKATLEQDGCYEGKEITYNVTLTDLPKPTITFTTLPSDAPQGSVQSVVATTDGGANFDVTVKSGSGYTITSKTIEDNICTMVLNIGADATDIVLTASTERISGVVSQHAVDGTLTVSQCIPNGSDIFSFTMAGSAATSGQIATGLVGGTVDQTALGTKGTDDNPATVAIKKLKFNNQFVTDVNATAQITTGKSDHSDEWYMLPAGTYDNKQMYYLKNVATGQYIYKDKSYFYGPNAGWKYYAVRTSSTNAQTDIYKWMEVPKDNVKRFANRESYVSNDYEHTHNMRPCVTEAANDWKTPYVGAGLSGHQGNTEWNSELVEVQSSAANPDMFKSVQYNSKTYYIVSSEGAITINCAIKEGDKIRIDTYDRKTEQANVVEITAQSDMSSYVYTTTNEYLCVAGITIFRPKYGEYATPTLTWDTDLSEPQLVDLNNGGVAATHTATSNVATIKTIAYSSNNSHITVDATTGAVSVNAKTPDHEEATITATLPAVGCYDEATTTYTILVKNVQAGSLQDAIDDIEDGGTLTLDWDYIGSDAEIDNKKMTIDAGGHKIGNLTITTTGDLTLSSAMTANDFVIESSQVEPVSGQLKGADKLTVAGSAYMDLSFGAEAVTAGWYAFTVPFAVSSTGGVYNANTGAKLTNETDYAIMHYQGDVRAQGQYGWIKTHKKGGVMQPGTLYIIAFGDTEYNKIRFKKASGALNTNTVAVHQYGGGTETDNGWNGVGNPSLAYGNATNTGGAEKAQFLDHASNAFVISEQEITDQTYVVSSAFFIQANTDDNMTFTVPDNIGELMAPRRASANKEFMLELSQGAQFQDRLYLSVSEEAKDEYEIGHDLVKMSAVNGNATVAQMAIEGYDMNLCDAEFPMSEDVLFPLVLSAPKAGEYTLSVQRACAEQGLFVVNDGVVVWDLKQGDYTLDLQKGTTYDYSLMLQTGERTMPTGTDVIRSANGVQKIILRQELRIIRDGKMFNAQGIEL